MPTPSSILSEVYLFRRSRSPIPSEAVRFGAGILEGVLLDIDGSGVVNGAWGLPG